MPGRGVTPKVARAVELWDQGLSVLQISLRIDKPRDWVSRNLSHHRPGRENRGTLVPCAEQGRTIQRGPHKQDQDLERTWT